MRNIIVILVGIVMVILAGVMLAKARQELRAAPVLSLPVASADEATRLSRDDQLGRYFDCLEYEVETSMLQTCEE